MSLSLCGTLYNHVLHLHVASIYSIHVSTVLEVPVDTVHVHVHVSCMGND